MGPVGQLRLGAFWQVWSFSKEGSERPLVKGKPQMQGRPQNVKDSRILDRPPRAVESVEWNLAKSTGQGVRFTESRD